VFQDEAIAVGHWCADTKRKGSAPEKTPAETLCAALLYAWQHEHSQNTASARFPASCFGPV
jgi:hypothetical protein